MTHADLAIGAVLPREDPRDAVVLPVRLQPDTTQVRLKADTTSDVVSGFSRTPVETLDDLAALLGRSPSIGTGSVRRIAQLSRLFPGARFMPIRGNLDTRLRKVDTGDFSAIVLAAAGLRRLEQGHRISATLPPSACVPAAQAVLTTKHGPPACQRSPSASTIVTCGRRRSIRASSSG